jgi:transcriptional regulator with XRE-family HTH domain
MARGGTPFEELQYLASQIKAARRRVGWKVDQLAEASGYSKSGVESFEAGRRGNRDTYQVLAGALNPELVRQRKEPLRLRVHAESTGWLTPALRPVVGERLGPAALLDARYGIAPWQGERRRKQLDSLLKWCDSGHHLRSFSVQAHGGMGKTRLAVALCERLNVSKDWVTGFVSPRLFPGDSSWWTSLRLEGRSLLMVADYAGRTGMLEVLNRILPTLSLVDSGKVRLLLLDRTSLWAGHLSSEAWHVHQQIQQGYLDQFDPELSPVSEDPKERQEMLRGAAEAFAAELKVPFEEAKALTLKNPKSSAYRQILLLHIQALERLFDAKPVPDRAASIFDRLLQRERDHWREGLIRHELPKHLLNAVEAAVAKVSELEGMENIKKACELLATLPELQGQPQAVVQAIANLLREVYPDDAGGVAPLRPDPVYDHLANARLTS